MIPGFGPVKRSSRRKASSPGCLLPRANTMRRLSGTAKSMNTTIRFLVISGSNIGSGKPSSNSKILLSDGLSQGDGSYGKTINKLAKAHALVIDDLGLVSMSDSERRDLVADSSGIDWRNQRNRQSISESHLLNPDIISVHPSTEITAVCYFYPFSFYIQHSKTVVFIGRA